MGTQDSLSSDVLQTGKVPALGPLLLLAWSSLSRSTEAAEQQQKTGLRTNRLASLFIPGRPKSSLMNQWAWWGSLTANMDGVGAHDHYPLPNMSDSLWTLDSRSTHSLQGSNRLESDLVSLLITSHTSHTTHTLYQTTPRSPWKKAKKYAFIISIMMPSVCMCVLRIRSHINNPNSKPFKILVFSPSITDATV